MALQNDRMKTKMDRFLKSFRLHRVKSKMQPHKQLEKDDNAHLAVPPVNNLKMSPILRQTCVSEHIVESCPWDTKDADLYIGVGKSLFPVHRSRIALGSSVLRSVIVTLGQCDEAASILWLGDYEVNEIRQLLKFIYFPERPIKAKHLETCTFLAEEFVLPMLKKKCADAKKRSDTLSKPSTSRNLAVEYIRDRIEEKDR